jgi:hypothetical protein
MNYYETKKLQDRESHLIGAGISLILFAPAFGIVAGMFLGTAAFYAATALFVLFGIAGLAGGIREKIERRGNINN